MSAEKTATEFFSAVESGDIDALRRIYDDNVEIWHSFSGATQSKDASIEMLGAVCSTGSLKYEVLERHTVGERFIQRHNVHLTTESGATFVIPAAVFITVQSDRITAIAEYVDSAQAGQVLSLKH